MTWKSEGEEFFYGYTGKEKDDDINLTYFGARFYLQDVGRWLTPDPLFVESPQSAVKKGSLGELNLYSYVGNNPIMKMDPLGLKGGNSNKDNLQEKNDEKPVKDNHNKIKSSEFKTFFEAKKAANKYFTDFLKQNRSSANKNEFGMLLYRNKDGFGFTKASKGGEKSWKPNILTIPKNSVVVAGFHKADGVRAAFSQFTR
ncbi:RHS repeat-associated core domain-containing protein [bacterium]|nr:RHS repeat-associated core domain-containing protein [bacterium]